MAEAHHFDGCHCCFKSLVSGLDACPVEGLFEVFAGEHAEAVGNSCFLLGLPDAASDFVVDGFVVGCLAAQEAAEGDDGIDFALLGDGAHRSGNFPCARHADNLDLSAFGSAAEERIECTFEKAICDDGVPARDNESELHAFRGEIALDGNGLAAERIGPGPEAEGKARLRFDGEDARLPIGIGDGGEPGERGVAALGTQPGGCGLIDSVESGDFNEDVGGGRHFAVDKFEIAERGEKRSSAAVFFSPACARGKSERRKEA